VLQRKQDLLLLEALLLGREIIIVHLAFEDGLDCLFCKVECGIDSLPAKEQAAKRRTERIRHEGSGRPAAKWLRYISATSLGTARPKAAAYWVPHAFENGIRSRHTSVGRGEFLPIQRCSHLSGMPAWQYAPTSSTRSTNSSKSSLSTLAVIARPPS
jgi:hypothetical protein